MRRDRPVEVFSTEQRLCLEERAQTEVMEQAGLGSGEVALALLDDPA